MKTRLSALFLAASALIACDPSGIPPTAPSASEAALIAAELATVAAPDRVEVAAAVATEIGTRFRCPRSAVDFSVLATLRSGFDTLLRPRIAVESAAVVDRLRVATNEACGIG